MNTLYIILSVILALACLCMITAILLQKKRQAGFSGNVGGMSGDKTYFDKNKARTVEGRLEKWTKILGGFFMILSLVIGFIA
ncbi:MAG: preprotein translocase subunit SecG [Clostridiales bacterium]|jgi:preprotein translocase subunit SecG|nr:preprotein translocase subunit SecG [Clostridiales bacterium]